MERMSELLANIEKKLSMNKEMIERMKKNLIEFLEFFNKQELSTDKNGRYIQCNELSYSYIESVCGPLYKLGKMEIPEMNATIQNNPEGFLIRIGNLKFKSPWDTYRIYVSMDR